MQKKAKIDMKRILVVDDDPGILEVTKLILEDNEYDVQTSQDGSVFERKAKLLPDLIILDVLLSGEDGRDILKKLKSLPNTKNIPVVMVSAHPSAKENALECGADDFISKPFEIDNLLDAVARNLN